MIKVTEAGNLTREAQRKASEELKRIEEMKKQNVEKGFEDFCENVLDKAIRERANSGYYDAQAKIPEDFDPEILATKVEALGFVDVRLKDHWTTLELAWC
jgi:ferredoxin-fold anticodon binding domain-containing protein